MDARLRLMRPEARRVPVLAVDRSPAVRWGIKGILEVSGHFLLVGEAADARSAARPSILTHGLIVMDAEMASLGDFRVLGQVRLANPHCAVLLLGEWDRGAEEERVQRAISAGASGYLRKDCCAGLLLGAALAVSYGATVVSRGAAPYAPKREMLAAGLQPAASPSNGAAVNLAPQPARASVR